MFKTLLFKEIHDHLKTFRFGAALVTTFVLVVISVWVLGDEYINNKEGFETLSASFKQDERAAYVPSMIFPVLFRPATPLNIFAQGPATNLGNSVQISRWSVPVEAEDKISNNVLLSSLPPFDLMTIFIFALSLFSILLSYDAFSGEKERGTLRILCTYPVPRPMIFLTKYLGCLAVICLPFIISFTASLIILIFIHGITFSISNILSLTLLLFSGLLYAGIFIGIGLSGSATMASSSSSLALSLLAWIILVVLVPATTQRITKTLEPLPPSEEISSLAQATLEEVKKNLEIYRRDNRISLASYGDNGPESEGYYWFDGYPKWLEDNSKFLIKKESLYMERADKLFNLQKEHLRKYREQEVVNDLLGHLSPAALLRSYFYSHSNTSASDFYCYLNACQEYRRQLIANFRSLGLYGKNVHKFFTRRAKEEMQSIKQFLKRESERERIVKETGDDSVYSMSSFPPLEDTYYIDFDYHEENFNAFKNLSALIALLIYSLLTCVAGVFLFSRYDIR